MSNLLEGKQALILGIANRWSLAYAIAQAFSREGASLVLTYLNDRFKPALEELAQGLNVAPALALRRDQGGRPGAAGRASSKALGNWTPWCTAWPSPIART